MPAKALKYPLAHSRSRDHLTAKESRWEETLDELDKQLDYEDIHGSGTSQHEGAWWRYNPGNSPKLDSILQSKEFNYSFEDRESPLDDRNKHVMEEVQRDLDFTARSLKFADLASESPEPEGETPTDFRTLVDIRHRGNAKESEEKLGGSREVEDDKKRLDFVASTASQLKKGARREAKAKERREGKDKLIQEVVDEWSRRMDILDGVKEVPGNFSNSQSEEQDPPKDKFKSISNIGEGRFKIVDSSTATKQHKKDQLDALEVEEAARAERDTLMDEKIRSFRQETNLPREEGSKEEDLPKPLADKKWTVLHKRWRDLEARRAQRQIPEPELGEQDDDSKLSDKSEDKREGESESESEHESEDESVGEGEGASLNIKPYAGGRRFFHNEAESPQIPTEELREQSESTQPFIHELYRLKPSNDPTFVSEKSCSKCSILVFECCCQ
ncbi:hypothetical protein DID88_009645 [Monilinia fructigena]|uniref:Uncharacterized protein n=1 Tax=Monilinia fructigena TaxID=38457 RepID=A0A395IMS7_9HELO|nr:hypothetical protein DID88_009645 [Monilinia fructigena]